MSTEKKLTRNLIIQNQHYLLSAEKFIKYSQKRDIRINIPHLDYYKKKRLISPILTKGGIDYYDPFQIYIIGEIEKTRLRSLELPIKIKHKGKNIVFESKTWERKIQDNLDVLQGFFKNYSRKILPFLISVRYYYLPLVTGCFSVRNVYPIPFPEKEPRLWGEEAEKRWEKDKENFNPKSILKKFNLSVEEIDNWRITIFAHGEKIDPLGNVDWYAFLKNLCLKDLFKYEKLRGVALLAQDYYQIAELLTIALKKITKKKPVELKDVFDLTGGKWKERKCENCGKLFRIKNWQERYCENCKKEISDTMPYKGAWRCKNKECGRVLYRYLDRNEIVNNLFYQAKKSGQIKTYVRLEYGLLTLICICGCGEKNVKQFDYGWI
jgi:hypothetical protein